MTSGIVYLRPLSVVSVRRSGRYPVTAVDAWAAMLTYVRQQGVADLAAPGYGLWLDDPCGAADDEVRYDACVSLQGEFAPAAGVAHARITGGPYLRQRFKGSHADVAETLKVMVTERIEQGRLKRDRSRPVIEAYSSAPRTFDAPVISIDLCVPVAI